MALVEDNLKTAYAAFRAAEAATVATLDAGYRNVLTDAATAGQLTVDVHVVNHKATYNPEAPVGQRLVTETTITTRLPIGIKAGGT